MKFIKENWLCMLIIGLAITFIILGLKDKSEFADRIEIMNDSIQVLNDRNQMILIDLKNSQDLFIESEYDILLYQDSLDRYRATIYRNRKNYEAALLDIISIPTDSMYLEVTGWLDSR